MPTTKQKIFSSVQADQLRAALQSGETLDQYFEAEFNIDDGGIFESDLEVEESIELGPTVDDDLESAIKLYEAYSSLDNTQASDKRFWTYLSHVTYKDYVAKRWTSKYSLDDVKGSPDLRAKTIRFLTDRWFVTGNARSLRRHALARLWWNVKDTVAPWEKSDEFATLENPDRYIYTKVLFSTQDIISSILERKVGWSDKLVFAILEYLRQNDDFRKNRFKVRDLLKEVNLMMGYRKLPALSFESLLEVIKDTAESLPEATE